jgi:polysaccharide pyruvyl transferase CsaB
MSASAALDHINSTRQQQDEIWPKKASILKVTGKGKSVKKKPIEIVISGWYGKFNAGDDAILEVFIKESMRRAACKVTVLSEAPEHIAQAPHVTARFHLIVFSQGLLKAILKGNLFRHLAEIRRADLFVLGGGGLLRDNTNSRNLLRLLDEIWFAKLFRKKTMLYAIGVGPFKTKLGKWLIGLTVKHCDLVTVRSEHCAMLLRELGIDAGNIHVVADPAFLLESQAPMDPDLFKLFEGGKKVGFYPTFALLRWWHDDAHLKRFAAALDALVESEGIEIVAMPMSVLADGFDDVKTARVIQALMKHPEAMQIYDKRLTAPELKWASGQAIMNITVRLHAMIFSLGCDVPVVAINYEPKVGNVFAEFGMPECLVTIDDELAETLAAAGRNCVRNLDAYSARISQRRAITAAAAAKTFDLMASLCQSGDAAGTATGTNRPRDA